MRVVSRKGWEKQLELRDIGIYFVDRCCKRGPQLSQRGTSMGIMTQRPRALDLGRTRLVVHAQPLENRKVSHGLVRETSLFD